MGRPASPFTWNVTYDPIIFILALALGIECPTYVDDLAGNCRGIGELFLLQILLLVVCQAAGLLAETHSCCWLRLHAAHPQTRAALARLPLQFREGDDGTLDIKGLPPLF